MQCYNKINSRFTADNSSYAIPLPSVASPKLPFASLRLTSHSRETLPTILPISREIDFSRKRVKEENEK